MEYNCYKDAFDAVVEDNDGVLPDLYEVFEFTIYCRPSYLTGPPTVAEIVAYALLEAAEDKVTTPQPLVAVAQLAYAPVLTSEPLHLDALLSSAVASIN